MNLITLHVHVPEPEVFFYRIIYICMCIYRYIYIFQFILGFLLSLNVIFVGSEIIQVKNLIVICVSYYWLPMCRKASNVYIKNIGTICESLMNVNYF